MPMPAVTANAPIQSLLAAAPGGDEVGQAEVRALDRLVHLLAQEVQGGCGWPPAGR
jgi:hypothetical protein